jgi:6-pyruvoyltetrahydropterin/6-carboxytetrahydropterin synthase
MRIFIEDSFDSAHFLPNVPEGHKCKRLHGHTYRIRLELKGDIGKETGWVMDYSDLKSMWEPLKTILDHHCLNDIDDLENPTCELLAVWIWVRLLNQFDELGKPYIARLEVRETANCGVVME